MLSRPLLLSTLISFVVLSAQAQQSKPDHFPRYPASTLARTGYTLASGLVPGALPAAPGPTVRAAALCASLPRPASRAQLDSARFLPPRHDLAGVAAAPPYDPYQNLPEEFRKRTLPIPWAEPLPLQLLRGLLGR